MLLASRLENKPGKKCMNIHRMHTCAVIEQRLSSQVSDELPEDRHGRSWLLLLCYTSITKSSVCDVLVGSAVASGR